MPIRRIQTATTVAMALRLTSFDPCTPIQAVIEEEGAIREPATLGPFRIVIVDSALGQGSHTVPASGFVPWDPLLACLLVCW